MSKRPLILSAALTLGFLAWLWHVGLPDVWWAQLQGVPMLWWIAMVAGMLLSYGLRAWRIRREFADVPGMRWTLALRIVLAHTALVNVLPLRSGELGFPWLMRRALQVSWLDASASLMWLRLQDACVLALLALWAWPDLRGHWRLGLTLALLVGLGLGVRWVRAHGAATPTVGTPMGPLRALTQALSKRGQGLWQGWLITASNWALKLSLQAGLLAQLLGLSWATGWAGALGAELSALLPVQGLGGVGSYEAGAAAALRWQGVDWALGLQAALSMHLVVLACSLGFGALAWWLPKPLVSRHNAS